MKGEQLRNAVSPFACVKVAQILGARADKETAQAWPSHERIAEDAALSVAQVRRALVVLENAGIVCRRRRQRESTVYTLIFECAPYAQSKDAVECAGSEQSERALIAQNAILTARNCSFDCAHGERLTEQTEQNTLNKKRTVRALKVRAPHGRGPDPSDALVEAVRAHTYGGSYVTAARDASQALRTVGQEREGALIEALHHPKTRNAKRPVAFAIDAVRKHGGVLERRPA